MTKIIFIICLFYSFTPSIELYAEEFVECLHDKSRLEKNVSLRDLSSLELSSSIVFTPKNCPFIGNVVSNSERKQFCLNFAADYFYRLHITEEDLTYVNGKRSHTMHRSKLSRNGALFMLGQVLVESGWGGGRGYASNNYWGLGGAYNKAGGGITLIKFPSFESSFAYIFNHFQSGVSINGKNSTIHTGWPDFLKVITEEKFTADDLNKSLNSGKWCKGSRPHYNVDPAPECAKKYNCKPIGTIQENNCLLIPSCPCVNYAKIIMNISLAQVIRECVPAFSKALSDKNIPEASTVYAKQFPGLPPKEERIKIALKEMSEFAQEKCLELNK